MDLDKFKFDDDEPKKKKKKSQKKKKAKRTVESRLFYETKLASLNGRLAALRSRFVVKNADNQKLVQELVTIEEDRVDVCEYLDRTIADRKTRVVELYNTLTKLETQRNEYKEWSEKRITDLQKQYDEDKRILEGEIVLQQRTLSSLDEFRLRRDSALAQFEEYNDGIADLDRQVKEDLYNMEQKAVVQKNVLKTEVEHKLNHLVEDFLHSYEIRNASYTRSLIQENIMLTKRMDKLVKQNIRTMEVREKQYLKTKEIMESYTSLEQLSDQLRRTIENKNDIIKQLTARTDRMRMKYIDVRRFRRLHDYAKSQGLFDKDGPKNFDEVVSFLERLNKEKNAIIQHQRVQENEIQRMRNVLDTLQISVERTINALQQLCPGETLDSIDRSAIISELIFLTLSDSLEESQTSGIYRQGKCGLIPLEYPDDMPLKVLYNRTHPSLTEESKVTSHTCSLLQLSTIYERSTEYKTLWNEQIGDGPTSSQISAEAKEMLEDEWHKIDLLADNIKTADQFQKYFEKVPSKIAMESKSGTFTSNTGKTSKQEVEQEKKTFYPIDKHLFDPF